MKNRVFKIVRMCAVYTDQQLTFGLKTRFEESFTCRSDAHTHIRGILRARLDSQDNWSIPASPWTYPTWDLVRWGGTEPYNIYVSYRVAEVTSNGMIVPKFSVPETEFGVENFKARQLQLTEGNEDR